MRNARHIVDVMSPAEALDDRGQPGGQDIVYRKQVPCSIETLNGREGELARQQFASATHRVEMYGDPGKPLDHTMYLLKHPEMRRLEIGFINDVHQNGVVLSLLCGEVVE